MDKAGVANARVVVARRLAAQRQREIQPMKRRGSVAIGKHTISVKLWRIGVYRRCVSS